MSATLAPPKLPARAPLRNYLPNANLTKASLFFHLTSDLSSDSSAPTTTAMATAMTSASTNRVIPEH
ncbi:hypothetical protein CDV36_008967 [Fusarium kuroshium]|uniref:Uncharacterized protein n=3 Tax=Fusarium solani species complex TaxID=232080 RepID=A0A3M2S2B7_9HYPO|nr:hypothetical protein CDV36_008967 [Fusarium kuroshium]RSL52354.1 hypothetical protein CEP51_015071 [Fusarium floridanum]RSL99670.1 hypothetical protein CEP52_009578 [Fusarium oligoseptatum]